MLRQELRISSTVYCLIIVQHFVWSIQTLRIENIRFVDERSNFNQLTNIVLSTVNQFNLSEIGFLNESIKRLNSNNLKKNYLILSNHIDENSLQHKFHRSTIFSTNQTNPLELNKSNRLLKLNELNKWIRLNSDHYESDSKNQLRNPRDVNEIKFNNESAFEESELYEIPNYLIVILTICYASISFFAIVGNLMILYIVVKSKKMQNPTNYLLANLSASDFLIGKFLKLDLNLF